MLEKGNQAASSNSFVFALGRRMPKVVIIVLNPLFRHAGQNYLKSRLRSHPDVARAHYADLLTPEELTGELVAASGY